METRKSLQKTLFDFLVEIVFLHGSGYYWPTDVVRRLVTTESVRRELNNANQEYSNELVEFIVDRAPKLFGILVVAHNEAEMLLQQMRFFRKNGYSDDCLSVEIGDSPDNLRSPRSLLEKEELQKLDHQLWGSFYSQKVVDEQWRFLVPKLSTSRENYNFQARTILPFNKVRTDEGDLGGAFSKVYKVTIQPGYLEDPQHHVSSISFTCKNINSLWQMESKVLICNSYIQ